MKAVDANLLELLKKSERFIVPIYQRVYSWGIPECAQLWTDIVRAGARNGLNNHFTGSIVYIEKDQGTTTSREPDLIIDGQQRVTTVTLVLAALAAHLDTLPEDAREPVAGFAPQKIRGLYLTNPYESGDEFFKLMLSKRDKDALKAVVRNVPLPASDSRIIENYQFFVDQLSRADAETVVDVCRGLSKLVVVDVKLTRGTDDPQLVFESMNATGKKLSEADLIRNFVLMDLPPAQQERLYEDYWFPMEKEFQGTNEPRFDEFVRHFLTVKTLSIPRLDEIYDAFKDYAAGEAKHGVTREELVVDLSRNAGWFAAMALETEPDRSLAKRFRELDQLATVAYPFQLRLYADYADGKLTSTEFVEILDTIIACLFRRAVCRIPTNSLNKTFATLAAAIDTEDYVGSICGRLLTLPDYRRFPSDEEFKEALTSTDLYHLKRRGYFFRAMENHGRKEEVSTAEYTIEHIMPQNANPVWQGTLGPDWELLHDRYLHTLGNLTLTGYNPEYSDRPFHEKRDMEGGFRDSPLRLNQGLGQLDRWDATNIERRAERLAEQAITIWPRPALSESELEEYRQKFDDSRRFDWSLTHSILAALPAGRWTSYNALAEAVGTGAQATARHLSTCRTCENAYRVLTWDGRIANDFRWTDGEDRRNPADVLRSEGVNLADGRAGVEQQLATEDLLALVGESEV
ncbi:GmrSD restriction endonuclease domain-containing protein [Microbacterium sp. MMO-10]|uniref:GmrSD restriction endonuclease domain-containing protein n=1 Tax=Microbacterium sp. MMO-10 TaxID=3081272 RepID=UPI00301B058F